MCVCVCVHVCEMSECYLQPEPIKKQRHRRYRCVSLWAQHETQKTASLIITYLSVCPPQGPPVTTADVPHWQARNTHTRKLRRIWKKRERERERERRKHSVAISLTGAGIQTHPWGGITMTTSSVGKAQVYYSIFGYQLASVAARLAGVHICLSTNGQFSLRSLWLYVCWTWDETSRNPCDQRGERIHRRRVKSKQAFPSSFVWLAASPADVAWSAENVCRQTGDMTVTCRSACPPFVS